MNTRKKLLLAAAGICLVALLFVAAKIFPAAVPSSEWLALIAFWYFILPIVLLVVLSAISLFAKLTDSLTVKPNRRRPNTYNPESVNGTDPTYHSDTFGFFTEVQDGQAKVAVIGSTFVKAIMHHPGFSFKGDHEEIAPEDEHGYYDVIRTPSGRRDTSPTPNYNWTSWDMVIFGPYKLMSWIWQKLTFKYVGLAFVGIWPIVKLKLYSIEYFDEAKNEKGEFAVKRRLNYSDHYRLMDFQFIIPIDSLDTEDLIPVSVVLSLIMRTVNVYRAAFKSDDNWSARFFARIPSRVNEQTGQLPVVKVIAQGSGGDSVPLSEILTTDLNQLVEEGGPIHSIGFTFVGDDYLTIPNRSIADKEAERKLGDLAIAVVDKKARITRAEGEAEAIRLSAAAANEPGGQQVADIEGRVRQAKAAGESGGTVILGGGGGNNPGIIVNSTNNNTEGENQ